MKLTKKLKEQLKILERNGVCGTSAQPIVKNSSVAQAKSQSPTVF